MNAKFGKILENAARLAGRQVGTLGVPDNWKALAELAIASGVRTLAAEKFPMMQRVEFRRYRPTWGSGMAFEIGQECWYEGASDGTSDVCTGHYWRKTSAGTGAPGTDGSGWTKLKSEEVWAFVNWDQPWESTAIDRAGVDANNFAYAADPKYNPHATPLRVVGVYEYGIELQAPAPSGVWIKFVPVLPSVTFTEWASGTMYTAGETVYRGTTKDVYQCVEDITESVKATAPESDTLGYWEPLRISGDFENYLTRLVASDLMTEDQGKFATKATADRELEILKERFHEGNGECRLRTGRFMQ